MTVITRFPPSPTGPLHIGSVRTALFNYLFARHHDGIIYFRFEDTDKERSKKEFEEDIVESLAWLGIAYTMPDIARQSERTGIYTAYFQKLLDTGRAYEAEEAKDGSGKVVRFKNPNTTLSFDDLIRGTVSFDTTELGDFVIAKNINEPLYHLAVVIDDHEMEVTHVIRGEDHISNTPRQILIQEALGMTRPIYAHIPLILAPDRSKLSKRHGATSANEYKKQGYLAQALVNYLALLGWHPEGEREIFSMEELIKEFDISRVQKGGAIFDVQKLNSINKEHLKRLSDEEFLASAKKFAPDGGPRESLQKILPLLRERVQVFSEIPELLEGELTFVLHEPVYEVEKLVWKGSTKEETREHLEAVLKMLEEISEKDFNAERIKSAVWEYAEEKGRGAVLWPLRYALTSQEKSPDPFQSAEILGKEESVKRVRSAIEKLLQHI